MLSLMVDISHAASCTVRTVPLCRNCMTPEPGYLVDLEHRQRIVERELPLGDEIIDGHEDRDLDQAGGRKCLVAAPVDARPCLEVDDAVADDAVMRVGDRIQRPAKGDCVRANCRQRCGAGIWRHLRVARAA